MECRRAALDRGDPLLDQGDEQVVDRGEMAVQDPLCHPGLLGHRAAREGPGPVADEDAFGGGDQVGARIAQGDSGGHGGSAVDEWARAHLEWARAHSTAAGPAFRHRHQP
ncbi:hypothetical protein GCM10009836_66130 [Pseudonocardia ailaonensis]|uniref:Uncharacterized protein n=1 Tax=Pseudonocardia ailaonensis TaxID=367279 RepID=A0ABN2NMB8_9PSEU